MTVSLSTLEECHEEIANLRAQVAELSLTNQELEQSLQASTIFFERSTELLSIISFDGLFKVISPAWYCSRLRCCTVMK